MRNKILMTLALLITAVGGAWADEPIVCTSADIGKVLCTDGSIYATKTEAETANKEATGVIVYVNAENTKALAIALADESATKKYQDALAVFADKATTVPNGKWVLPSKEDWENMFTANGGNVGSCAGLNAAITTAGGTALVDNAEYVYQEVYWTSTIGVNDPQNHAFNVHLHQGTATIGEMGNAVAYLVRGAIEFAVKDLAIAPALEVIPGEAANTWTFTMPTYDVELTPVYAPVAQWAKDNEVDQIPAAIEGIFAGTDDIIVAPGTVANMGNTEDPQGIVMYAVTSTDQATAPELSAFSDVLPTAKNIADEGAEVLVWYYIHGFDTPEGQEATAENTFNDSEIASIKVTVLSNKYDIQFNAANANTIEAGKATVKVGETAAEVKEGKLTGVKMESKVTITAKDGYKFRKVEGKKAEALKTINVEGVELKYADGDTWEQVVQKNSDKLTISNGGNIYYGDKYLVIKISDWLSEQVFPNQNVNPNANYCWAN